MRLERLRSVLMRQIQTIDESILTAQNQGVMATIQALNLKRQLLIQDEEGQRAYANMILQIGNGIVVDSEQLFLHAEDTVNYKTTYNFRTNKCFILLDKEENEPKKDYQSRVLNIKMEALTQFFPNGF